MTTPQPAPSVPSQEHTPPCLLDVGTHAALAAVLDGAVPENAERQIGDILERLSDRAFELSEADANDRVGEDAILAGVRRALFTEQGLHAAPPHESLGIGASQGEPATVEAALAHARSSLVHHALEAGRGTPLCLGLILSEVLRRVAPARPAPRLLALPRASAPLATFSERGGLVRDTSELHDTVQDALRSQPTATSPAPHEHRILVAWAGAAHSARPVLLDPTARGAATRLACSDALLTELSRGETGWNESGAAPRTPEHTSPWEVPASALLNQRGVMELLLKQLVGLYHAAGTPHAIRMHHRCAALLEQLEQAQ